MGKWDKYKAEPTETPTPSEGGNRWDKYKASADEMEAIATRMAEEKYEAEAPSALEASGLGLVQGVARNYGDGMIAKAASLFGGDEEQAKHKLNQRIARSKDEQPLAYTSSNIVGSVGSALPLATASVAGNMALAGVDGAVRTIGDDGTAGEAAFTGALDAATAGVITKVAPHLIQAARKYGAKGAEWLKQLANSQAVKSLGGTKGQVEKLGDKSDEIGAMLLKEKVVTPLASSKEIAERVSARGEDLAAKTAPIYQEADNAGRVKDLGIGDEIGTPPRIGSNKVSTGTLLDEIQARIASLESNPGNAPIISKLRGYAKDLENAGQTGFGPSELRKYRQAIDKTINFNSDAPSQLASKEMRGLLREEEMSAIGRVDPALREANEELFKNIHLNMLAEDMAEKGAARSAVNNEIGLNTWQAGTQAAAAGMTGGTSAAVMAVKEFLKRYGNQLTAVGADKVSKAMLSGKFAPAFAKAAEKGPSAVAAVHEALKGNPEYQKEISE